MSENRIEFSTTGRVEDKEMWALCATNSSEVLREWALNLLVDLRDRHSKAEVWVNGRKYSPTAEELDAYRRHTAEILRKESLLRQAKGQAQDVVEVSEEPQPATEEPKTVMPLPTGSDGLLMDPRELESDLDF